MKLPPDRDLSLRRPALRDAPSLADLTNAADEHDYGLSEMTNEEARDELARMDLPSDAWILERAGQAVAFAGIRSRGQGVEWDTSLTVHPDWRRRGIGTALARGLEERAREHVAEAPIGARVAMRGWIKADSPAIHRWAKELGFTVQRQFLRMGIQMTELPPAPEWPPGMAVRSFVHGRDERPTFDALEEAFSDHWGHVPAVFEEWVTRTRSGAFDPQLTLLVTEGEEIVATSFGSIGGDGAGWVSGLGTRRAWRGRGIGRAILLESFRRFWERGVRAVALGVDGESLTGATRLYERAGMRVVERYDQVARVLREGVDQAKRDLA